MKVSAYPYILAIGDSLTAGYGLSAAEAFPARLQYHLRSEWPESVVENAGVSGDTTESALARLPRLLGRLNRRPDLAIVELGANDVIRSIPPTRVAGNFDAIVEELKRCAITPLIATFELPPFVDVGYAAVYERLADRHDVHTALFFPPETRKRPELLLADGFHPNARAIELVAAAFAPAVIDTLTADPSDTRG